MSPKRKQRKQKRSNLPLVILLGGACCIFLGIFLLLATFWPVLANELRYQFRSRKPVVVSTTLEQKTTKDRVIKPLDDSFGIVIPKIGANARIIPNVDPYNQAVYQQALTKGVAHAKGSVFPGRVGNVFIFSHSSVDFFEALRYNSVFYLLDKLEPGDDIYLFFNHEKFTYKVTEKKLVEPTAISYLTQKTDQKMVTLMTCWPPGTTFKRLIVQGTLLNP